MSDATEPRPTTPLHAEGSLPKPGERAADPLAGDWSDGMRGPARDLGVLEVKLLVVAPEAWAPPAEDPLQSQPPAPPPSEPPSVIITFTDPPPAFPDTTPPAPAPAFADPTPPAPAPAFALDVTPSSPAPAFAPDVTPPGPVPSFEAAPPPVVEEPVDLGEDDEEPESPAGPVDAAATAADPWASAVEASPPVPSAPTPWSESTAPVLVPAAPSAWDAPAASPEEPVWSAPPTPAASWDQVTAAVASPVLVPEAPSAWQTPAASPEEPVWSPPPAAEPIPEWKAEAPDSGWQEVKKTEAPAFPEAPAADWGTMGSGPDWSAPPPVEALPAGDAWGSAPPPPVEPEWGAPAPVPETSWDATAPAAPVESTAEGEWSAPAAAAPAWSAPAATAAPAWNAAPAGASALEQMDSEPEMMEPTPGAAKDLFGSVPVGASLSDDAPPEEDLGPPEELASPEDVLKPLEEQVDDDPNLLVPVDDSEPRTRPAQPLAQLKPSTQGALEVAGEQRVAVHTRGGRTRRGTVKDVDLSKSQFVLLPQGGGTAEPIYHAEVKAIFFMLAPGEKPRAPEGAKVRVTFADGRSIEGYRDGPDAKHGFFLIPLDAARTNTRRIYVAREATTEIK